jgi:hypothetical protein
MVCEGYISIPRNPNSSEVSNTIHINPETAMGWYADRSRAAIPQSLIYGEVLPLQLIALFTDIAYHPGGNYAVPNSAIQVVGGSEAVKSALYRSD